MSGLGEFKVDMALGEIGFSEEQADLLEVATVFCRDKSPMEKVRNLIDTEDGYDLEIWQEMAALGWLGIAVPEAYGGAGLTLAEVVPVVEQMGRRMMATPFVSTSLAAQALLEMGSEAQCQAFLPELGGGKVATLALLEGDGEWDLSKITSAGIIEADKITLSGTKHFVCDAKNADYILVSIQIDAGPALVILKAHEIPHGALRRETVIDETKRSYLLTLDGIEVAASRLLDSARSLAGFAHLQNVAALLSAAESCGGAQSVIDYTIDYLKTRKQFGKTIGSYQALKHPIVDAYVQYEQARCHLYSAANSFPEQGIGEIATRMAKAQADTALSHAADRSIQFHGGFGFTYDCDAQLYRRRAMWHAALYGDAAYHKKKLADLLF